MYHDQVWIIRRKQIWFNSRKSNCVIYQQEMIKGEKYNGDISISAKKGFNKIQHLGV